MSLIMGARFSPDGGVLLASDTLYTEGEIRTDHASKIDRFGQWLIAHVGSGTDWHRWKHGVTGEEPLDDPFWHAERMARLRAQAKEYGDAEPVNLGILLARGGDLYSVNDGGKFWEVRQFEAYGTSWTLAQYLWETRGGRGMTKTAAVDLLADIIAEVAKVDRGVDGPCYVGDLTTMQMYESVRAW